MSRLAHAWQRASPAIGTRWAALVLGVISLLVYAVEALAWPVQRGRDAWDYLTYYLSLFDGSTPFPLVMLLRTPVTPLLLGPAAQLGGATGLELLGGLMFAVTIVAWAAVALTFSRLAAVLTALVLLATTPFALPFHEPSSDMVVAAGFALFSLGLVRTCLRPTAMRFALLGLGVAVLVLARPSYQVLFAAGLAALLVGPVWASRLRWAAAFLAAGVLPLAVWAVHNGVRYGDPTVSRSGALNVPFYPAFLRGELDPGNGPASARLARLIEREILVEPPYRRLGVDARTFMRSGTNYEAVHLFGLHDRVFGLDSDYELLRAAAREAPGGTRIRGVEIGAAWRVMRGWLVGLPQHESRVKPDTWPESPPIVEVAGRPMPNPAALPPAPDAVPYGYLQCASDHIQRCVVDDSAQVFRDAVRARRYGEITRTVARWDEGLGAREANGWLAAALERLRRALPAAWLWLVVAVLAGAYRRPASALVIATPALLALLILTVHALGGRGDPFFALPVLAAFPTFALTALTTSKRRPGEGLA